MASPSSFPNTNQLSNPASPSDQLNDATLSPGRKRKRAGAGGEGVTHESASPTQERTELGTRRRQTLSKRACNECRQQKLRCDVVVEPDYHACSRCRRLGLECRIDANFRRIDKRSRHMEMENELQDLRRRLAEKEPQASASQSPNPNTNTFSLLNPAGPTQPSAQSLSELHQGAADSLLELRHSAAAPVDPGLGAESPRSRKLEKVILSADQVNSLFRHYFEHYHPFLPMLDPSKPPDYFFQCSELLFWTIIAVAARRYEDDSTLLTGIACPLTNLIWRTAADVTQNYHVVKALCLICTWPLPTKTSSKDPTFMFAGLMMQIALQTGLHRPSHVQEYSRVRLDLREEDVIDRLKTWAGCNIVSQTVSTGLGQPPRSQWDYTLTSLPSLRSLPLDLQYRVQIERLCNKISRLVYMNRSDPIGLARDEERPTLMSVLSEDYRDLEAQMKNEFDSPIARLHLQAVGLHLKLCAFFDSPAARTYKQDLHELYSASITFLNTALDCPSLCFVSMYMMQMILASGFTLAKLLNSFFKSHTDLAYARNLFNQTIMAIRKTSIYNNDLPARLAEVLAQLWRSYGASIRETPTEIDDSLQLRVRARLSVSVVYDSVWRWREKFVFKTEPNMPPGMLPDNGNGSSNVEPSTAGSDALSDTNPQVNLSNGSVLPMNPTLFGDVVNDLNYEVFEPLMSLVDGNMDFPYNDPLAPGTMSLDSNLFS